MRVAAVLLEEVLGRAMHSPVTTAAKDIAGRAKEQRVDGRMAVAAAVVAAAVAAEPAAAAAAAVVVGFVAAAVVAGEARATEPAWAEEATLRMTLSDIARAQEMKSRRWWYCWWWQ